MIAGRKFRLDSIPQRLGNDKLMPAWVAGALVDNLTQVNSVLEQMEDAAAPEGDSATMRSAGANLDLGPQPFHAKQRH